MSEEYWDKQTRDRWFFLFFLATIVAVAVLFSPYLYALLFASVAAVVTWPLFTWVRVRVGGRDAIAAGLTLACLFLLVFGPLTGIGWLFVNEASYVVADANDFFEGGEFDAFATRIGDSTPAQVMAVREWLATFVPPNWLPEEGAIVPAVVDWAREVAVGALRGIGNGLPSVLEGAFGFGLDAIIFLFALFTLYLEGPRLLVALMHLSPMEDRYEKQLFSVFRELANNMVLATLVTAAIQGVVSAIGFRIAGLDAVVFLGILAGVCSFIPLVGTGLVWIPCAVVVGLTQGWGWAVFLSIWSLVFTGSVDNVVKPLVLRGNTRIHPLLIFLAVFGGLAWFGPVGVLIGPLLVAFFLAAYTIYMREYLGIEVQETPPKLFPAWLTRWIPLLGSLPKTEGPAQPDASASEPSGPVAADPDVPTAG